MRLANMTKINSEIDTNTIEDDDEEFDALKKIQRSA